MPLLHMRHGFSVVTSAATEKKMTEELIDLTHYAPTAKNTQLLHWLVSQGRDRLEPLVEQCVDWMRDKVIAARQAGTDPIPRGAPVLIVMHAPSD